MCDNEHMKQQLVVSSDESEGSIEAHESNISGTKIAISQLRHRYQKRRQMRNCANSPLKEQQEMRKRYQ
jgi:hypothetical protein